MFPPMPPTLMGQNSFSGSIPASWGGMTAMYQCYLDRNQLSGSLPESISAWSKVDLIDFSRNQLSGNLPSTWGNGGMATLRSLQLEYNMFTGNIPTSWLNFPSIKTIDLGYNQLNAPIPSSIGYLTSLQTLRLNDNQIPGSLPSVLNTMPGISGNFGGVDVGNNLLSGTIPPMTNIKWILSFDNNYYVAELDLSGWTGRGNVQAFANHFYGHGLRDKSTEFDQFVIWSVGKE